MIIMFYVSAPEDIFRRNLEKCSDGIDFIHESEIFLLNNDIVDVKKLSLMHLEKCILDLSACSSTAGIHYHLCINGKIFHVKGRDMVSSYSVCPSDCHEWNRIRANFFNLHKALGKEPFTDVENIFEIRMLYYLLGYNMLLFPV